MTYEEILATIRDKIAERDPDLARRVDYAIHEPIDAPQRIRELIADTDLYGISEDEMLTFDDVARDYQQEIDDARDRRPLWQRI